MPDSVGAGGFPRNINIGHEHLDLSSGFTYQYQGGVPTDILSWKIIGGVTQTSPSTSGWGIKQLGAMWFNSNDRAFKYWDGTAIQTILSTYTQENTYKTRLFLEDDFVSGGGATGEIGALGWLFTGGSTSVTIGAEPGRPGIVRRSTSAAINTITATYHGFTQVYRPAWNIKIQLQSRLNDIADLNAYIGLMTSTVANPPGWGAYFHRLAGEANWSIAIGNNTGLLITPTTAVVDTAFHKYEVRLTNGTLAEFYYDNTFVGSLSGSQFPASLPISPSVTVVNTVGVDKSYDLDYYQAVIENFGTRL